MRIISGKHKSRKISAPTNLPVRPTTDRAKEALFNIVQNRYNLKKIKFLDLFAGTGNISFEMASRGCKDITAIDVNYKCTSFIKQTSSLLEFNINVIKSECLQAINKIEEKYDFIFADPPYNYTLYRELKDGIFSNKILNENGCLIIEHDRNTKFQEKEIVLEERKYGTVHFSIFTH